MCAGTFGGHAETMNTLERRARFANGLLVLVSSLLMLVPALANIGFWTTCFMGLSLVFSGITGFCGWVRLQQSAFKSR